MADINENLREAARTGSEVEVKALLRDPGCDTLSKDDSGRKALMYDASYGQESCIKLLLPVSDASSKDTNRRAASDGAKGRGHEVLAQLVDVYVLVQSEKAAIGVAAHPRA